MRTAVVSGLVGLAAAVCLCSAGAFAQTTTQTTTYGPFSVTCTSSGQLCAPAFQVNVTTTGPLQLEYTASTGHCSDVRVHFLVDGAEVALSAFLAPGQSSGTFNVGPVSPGAHVIAFQGEGQVGGCNSGSLAAWGGTAQVTVGTAATAPIAEPIPGPGIVATAIVFLLGAALFGFGRSRR